MATKYGWRLDRVNSRLDFYYNGTRIGAIDAGGIDLATGLTFDVNGSAVTASTLDAAYDGSGSGAGRTITVDGAAIVMAGSSSGTDVLQITKAGGAGACLDFANSGDGKDIEGTSDTWTISKAGAAVFTTIAGTALTLSSDIDLQAGTTGTYDLILNDAVADALSITREGTDIIVFDTATPKVTITPATTITGAVVASAGLTCSTGGITVSAGTTSAITSTNINLTGIVGITGNTTITGDLAVSGGINWGGTFTTDELILDSDGVAPDGATYCYAVSDNTGDVTINALSGKEIHLAIADNDEYDFNATALQLKSGNYIQFEGDNGIKDSAGNEVILVTAVGSAINYLNVRNAATANPIILECLGTADKGFQFHNDQNEEILSLTPVASALYNINVISAASGGKPTIQTEGAADIGIDFETSENEEILTLTPVSSAVDNINIVSATTGASPVIQSAGAEDIGIDFETSEGEEMLQLVPVATAINHIVITSAASGAPTISCSAADTGIIFAEGTATKEEILILTATAGAVAQVTITSAATGTNPSITASGETNTGLDIIASGTGAITLNNGTDPVILKFLGAQAGFNNEIQDVNGCEIIALQGVASAVCEIGISNAVASSPAFIKAQGETNSNLMIDTTGTGTITLALGGDEVLRLHDAAAMTFAAAADTAGHAIYVQTEDGGTDGGTASTGQAGALLHISTGDGSAAVTTGAVGGAGGALSIVTGAGATGETAGNGGVGGALAITAGAGGASGAGAGTGGNGGSIILTVGAAGGAGGGTAGKAGNIRLAGRPLDLKTVTNDNTAGNTTYTAAAILGGIITRDPAGASRADTLPTGANIEAACGASLANGDSITCYLINTADAAETITLGVAAGTTISNVGQTIAQDEAATLIFTRTAANTYVCYIVGA